MVDNRTLQLLKKVVPFRLRRFRRALASGRTMHEACTKHLEMSRSSVKRYINNPDHYIKEEIARYAKGGEALRSEPMGEAICYWLDVRDTLINRWYKMIKTSYPKKAIHPKGHRDVMAHLVEVKADIHQDHIWFDDIATSICDLAERVERDLQTNEEMKAFYYNYLSLTKPAEWDPLNFYRWYWQGVPKQLHTPDVVKRFNQYADLLEEQGRGAVVGEWQYPSNFKTQA